MAYMTHGNIPTSQGEWWKHQSNPAQQRVALDAFRSAQRDLFAFAWRRIAVYGAIAVIAPFVIHLLAEF